MVKYFKSNLDYEAVTFLFSVISHLDWMTPSMKEFVKDRQEGRR